MSVALAGLVLPLAGCGDEPVSIPARPLPSADAAACETFVADLPDAIGDQERRLTNPAAALGAAWGDPATVLRCGAPVPEGLDRFSDCQVSGGVGWYVPGGEITNQSGDLVMTAVTHRPLVSVRVPGEERPEGVAAAMSVVSAVVKRDLEQVRSCG